MENHHLSFTETILEDKIVTAKRPSRESSGGGNWKYQCDYCGIGYHNIGSVTSHRCRKHKEAKYKEHICFKCGEIFANSTDVMQHALIHQSVTPFLCEKCGLNFISEKMLSRHIVGAHGTLNKTDNHEAGSPNIVAEASKLEINQCETTKSRSTRQNNGTIKVTSTKKLATDTFKGYGNWEFQCDFCGMGYHSMGSVTGHRCRKHQKPEEQEFKCFKCERVFENSCDLKLHALAHISDTPFYCKTCGLGFTTEHKLFKHTVGAHGAHRESGRFTQNITNTTVLNGLDYKPTEVEENSSEENIKKRKLSFNTSLKELFDQDRQAKKRASGFSSAGGNWEYQCNYCGIGYHTIGSISSHRWRKHEKREDHAYRCFECKEVFESSSNVMQHALVHLADTPFNCDTCGLNFLSETVLNKHKVAAHGIHRNQVESISDQHGNNDDEAQVSEDMSQLETLNENTVVVESPPIFQSTDLTETLNVGIGGIKQELLDQLEQNLSATDESVPVGLPSFNNMERFGLVPGPSYEIRASTSTETTPVPLPVMIYQRAGRSDTEVNVTWIQELELHTVTAVCLNAANNILCVRLNEDIFNYSDHMKKLIKAHQPQSVNFTILDGDDETTQWTLYTFGDRPLPTGLRNKLFKSYQMVEMLLRDYASNEQKTLIHLMQFSENERELFPLLGRQMLNPLIGCNHVQSIVSKRKVELE